MASATSQPITAPPDLVLPDYNLYRFRHDLYKVVRNASTAPRTHLFKEKGEGFVHDDKLPQALSRARRVCLELALCNEWKWFATFTIAKNNYDRKNLDGFYERFQEWLKYQRKKYDVKIPYLLVPEQHGDGSWHMHGFFTSDIDPMLQSFRELDKAGYRSADGKKLPRKLIAKDYYNLPAYQERFGFCSFGKIRNHDATAFYATKYISKSFQGDAKRVGLKLYYCSQGLNRASYFESVYGPCPALDGCLVNHYQHCSTGFYAFQREPGDDPLLEILEAQREQLYPMQIELHEEDFADVVDYYETSQQLSLWS